MLSIGKVANWYTQGTFESIFPRANDTPATVVPWEKPGLQCWLQKLPSGLWILKEVSSPDSDSGSQNGSFQEQNEVVKSILAMTLPGTVLIWTNAPSYFYYRLLILEKDRTFHLLIQDHSKVKTIQTRAAGSCNKNAASSQSVCLCRGWDKCHVYNSGKGTLIKRLMARWALNLLFCFSRICMKLCLWNHILLKWVIRERNICSEINRKIEQRNSMLCPLYSLWWRRVQEVWRAVWGTVSPITHGHSWLSFPAGLLKWVMTVRRKAQVCCSNTCEK